MVEDGRSLQRLACTLLGHGTRCREKVQGQLQGGGV